MPSRPGERVLSVDGCVHAAVAASSARPGRARSSAARDRCGSWRPRVFWSLTVGIDVEAVELGTARGLEAAGHRASWPSGDSSVVFRLDVAGIVGLARLAEPVGLGPGRGGQRQEAGKPQHHYQQHPSLAHRRRQSSQPGASRGAQLAQRSLSGTCAAPLRRPECGHRPPRWSGSLGLRLPWRRAGRAPLRRPTSCPSMLPSATVPTAVKRGHLRESGGGQGRHEAPRPARLRRTTTIPTRQQPPRPPSSPRSRPRPAASGARARRATSGSLRVGASSLRRRTVGRACATALPRRSPPRPSGTPPRRAPRTERRRSDTTRPQPALLIQRPRGRARRSFEPAARSARRRWGLGRRGRAVRGRAGDAGRRADARGPAAAPQASDRPGRSAAGRLRGAARTPRLASRGSKFESKQAKENPDETQCCCAGGERARPGARRRARSGGTRGHPIRGRHHGRGSGWSRCGQRAGARGERRRQPVGGCGDRRCRRRRATRRAGPRSRRSTRARPCES